MSSKKIYLFGLTQGLLIGFAVGVATVMYFVLKEMYSFVSGSGG